MKCSKHTLIIGAALVVAGLLAYVELPQFHALIASTGPVLLLVLLCPLSMMFMMKGMRSDDEQKTLPSDTPRPEGSGSKK
jgi:hypothetical protein